MDRLRPGDAVVVFTTLAGRFRPGLFGTVMVLSTRVGRGERITVLLERPTEDGFAVLEARRAEVVVSRRRDRNSHGLAAAGRSCDMDTEIPRTVTKREFPNGSEPSSTTARHRLADSPGNRGAYPCLLPSSTHRR